MPMTILDNLRRRKKERKSGVTSEIVTGLVVQGGGMRGVYSMAALMALEESGFDEAFDNIFGSSAGPINGAYMLAKQSRIAVTVYVDDISNKKFVNMLRLYKIVDIDFLVDEALTKIKPLNVDRVIRSDTILHIWLTDYLSGKPVCLNNHTPHIDLMEAIRATAALPILYNKPVEVLGRKYIDGGVTNGIPLISAIEAGCTDIVVVLTRPASFRRRKISNFMKVIEYASLMKYPPRTRKAVYDIDESFNLNMELIEPPERIEKKVNLLVVHPNENEQAVGRTTNDRNLILQGAYYGYRDMRNALKQPVMSFEDFNRTLYE